MEWAELTKSSLDLLKKEDLIFWCYTKDMSPFMHPLYRICLVIRLEGQNRPFPFRDPAWYVLTVGYNSEKVRDVIDDEDMLDFFGHYCIVDYPVSYEKE